MLPARCTVYRLAKNGFLVGQSEDSYAFRWGAGTHCQCGWQRTAVADGATQGGFSGVWSRLLARSFVRHPWWDIDQLQSSITALAPQWHKRVFARPLPWFAEAKARIGPFSTLVGLELRDYSPAHPNGGTWRAVAVGDSCLFHIRDDSLRRAFPLTESAAFGNAPLLISSRQSQNARLAGRIGSVEGEWQAGDMFFLATDAMAQWVLVEHERGRSPWREVLACGEGKYRCWPFRAWAKAKRRAGEMRNDDLTCIVVRL